MARINLLKRLNPIDWLIITYITITFLYILFFFTAIPNATQHLIIRILLSFLILNVSKLDRFYNRPVLRFIRIAYPLALMAFFYSETDALNNIFWPNLDYHFARWDAILFGIQPSLEFYRLLPQGWFCELMNFCYVSYYFLIIFFLIQIFRRDRNQFIPTVFIIIASFFIYYLIYIILPVGGPQYFFHPPYNTIQDSGLFRFLVKMAENIGERPTAAFPSSHVGIIMILNIIAITHLRKSLWWLLPFFAGICFSTVYIKAHYAVDILGGIVSAPLIYYLTLLLWRKVNPPIITSNNNLYANDFNC